MKLETLNSEIQLLPEKAVFLAGDKSLVLADLHFGKINHFRRAGLPVPPAANVKNTETLIDLINRMKPARIIFLGDLFHSHYNEEWEVVGQIVRHFPSCRFELVRGNHDIMSEQQYRRHGITLKRNDTVGRFLLTHEPMNKDEVPIDKINMAGHLHPGARLEGKGRQAIMLPCFWFAKNHLVLPAFGSFTGLARIRPEEGDEVYIILEDRVIPISAEQKSQPGILR